MIERNRMRASVPGQGDRGFTLIESLIAVVIGTIVIMATYGVLMMQTQVYRTQGDMEAVHQTLQSAGHLLTWELRQLSVGDDDIVAMTDSTITVRSGIMSAIVCRKIPGNNYDIRVFRSTGETPAVGDSMLVFLPGIAGPSDDEWKTYAITTVETSSVGNCGYSTTTEAADMRLRFTMSSADTAKLAVGSPVMPFENVTYGSFMDGGERWVGRRIGNNWEKFGGPLMSTRGLQFTYRNDAGSSTSSTSQVGSIEILMRAASSDPSVVDSVSLKVWPRG